MNAIDTRIDTAIRAAASAIVLDKVSKSYDGTTQVIPPLDAELRAGEREDLGSHAILAADLGGNLLRIATPFGAEIGTEANLSLTFPPARLHLFDAETGRAIPDALGAMKADA